MRRNCDISLKNFSGYKMRTESLRDENFSHNLSVAPFTANLYYANRNVGRKDAIFFRKRFESVFKTNGFGRDRKTTFQQNRFVIAEILMCAAWVCCFVRFLIIIFFFFFENTDWIYI